MGKWSRHDKFDIRPPTQGGFPHPDRAPPKKTMRQTTKNKRQSRKSDAKRK